MKVWNKKIVTLVVIGFGLAGCGSHKQDSTASRVKEVSLKESWTKIPEGTILKLKNDLQITPNTTEIRMFRVYSNPVYKFAPSAKEIILKAGFEFVVKSTSSTCEKVIYPPSYDWRECRDEIQIQNRSKTFAATIMGNMGDWSIGTLTNVFAITQPAPVVLEN